VLVIELSFTRTTGARGTWSGSQSSAPPWVAGFEHADGWDGADRGLVGGTLYGTGLLVAHAIAGTGAKTDLPGFAPILIVFTAIIGMVLGALGGKIRGSAMQRRGLPAPPTRRRPA
jgi:hypothetical protein